MLQGWFVVGVAFLYIGLLFAIASYGDRASRGRAPGRGRPLIYALSLGVYCTSWTFFGSVGLAASRGLDFLTIYIGPILLFALGYPLLLRLINLAKAERITSIADFMAARYGKSQPVAAVVAIIALIGTIPYIALQLKAVATSVTAVLSEPWFIGGASLSPWFNDVALLVTAAMALFAILFGTRHIDATEHQEGLMLAVAAESVVKLIAFLIVGLYVTYVLFDGPGHLMELMQSQPAIAARFQGELHGGSWIGLTLMSFFAALMLPRQFHVTVTENNSPAELRRATWLFPVYLILINLFVVPIAIAGLITFGDSVHADGFVLALPMNNGASLISLIAFIGGLSAATAMVIVASVALAIMISNDLVMPLILRRRGDDATGTRDMGQLLIAIRRGAILGTLFLAFAYYRMIGDSSALASIGLLSFAAIAQFAPAFLGGLIWRGGTARGAIAGMLSGFAVWAYTLLLPSFVDAGLVDKTLLTAGPFGIWLLRPQALFSLSFDPYIHGVFWSLSVNIGCYVFVSLTRMPTPLERLQANVFVPSDIAPTPAFRLWRTAVTLDDLKMTVARYLGDERTERAFVAHLEAEKIAAPAHEPADARTMRFAEQLLASAIGAASSRLVLSLLVERRDPASKGAMKLLDDATTAIQYNRDLLQTALDQVEQGIAVFDAELRLTCWNRRFRELLGLPGEYGHVGTPLYDILTHVAEAGEFGPGAVDALVGQRLEQIARQMEDFQEQLTSGSILEIHTSPMPTGGIVITFSDITERVLAEEALARANETLEKRVRERTMELTRLNQELTRAKRLADEANLGKTRFLAGAGHDILQPLNAARLYAQSLVERFSETENRELVENVEASLDSVEEIIGAVLDMSRLDTGAMKPEISVFPIDDILSQLRVDFEPMARDRGLDFRIVPCGLSVRSDRRLLRRLLQNLASNAIKYTERGKVLIGCRRRGKQMSVEVLDTGIGVPPEKRREIFAEFSRLERGVKVAPGLGLGLSIVERIARVLGHPVTVESEDNRGSHFSVLLPVTTAVPLTPKAETRPAAAAKPLTGLSVLCIDNEPKILSGMETLLTGWGCHVVTARSVADAETALADSGVVPDILLLDYHLDTGTGIEAARQLRWHFGTRTPGALITADRSPAVRQEAEEKGLVVLQKPVKPAALRAFLTQVNPRRSAAE